MERAGRLFEDTLGGGSVSAFGGSSLRSLELRRADRRQDDRRHLPRGGEDRRKGDRRQGAAGVVRGLALVSCTLAASPAMASTNPLAGASWFVDPYSPARLQAETWRASRPEDAVQMDKLAVQPAADWFGDWSGDIQAAVDRRVSAITGAGALPVLVAYNIPNRDCGNHSAGGAVGAGAYRDWIRRFALGIGTRPAVVVLEPDALGLLGNCGSPAEQEARLALLWDAVQLLKAEPAVAVYLDAGHSSWMSVGKAADRLLRAGVAQADGFALNVSSFQDTAAEIAYGRAISQRVGGKHFLIDTSRNGLGPKAGEWCNPDGRALGKRPTAETADPLVDAYVWIKRPGESDGRCNGGPSNGVFWPEYALGLAQRSVTP